MKGNINPEYAFEVRKIYGNWIKQLREEKGYTQEELAEKMGMTRTTISKIEDGKWNYGINTITLFAVHLDFFLFMIPKDSNDDLAKSMRDRWKRVDDDN